MTRVHLERFCYAPSATFGRLTVGEDFQSFCVEPPWRDNRPGISCIPEGKYPLVQSFFYRKGYPTWEVKAVPDRTGIKIHIANTASELDGCIAPGRKLGILAGQWAVKDSAQAFYDFMDAMVGAEEAVIEIDHFCPKGE